MATRRDAHASRGTYAARRVAATSVLAPVAATSVLAPVAAVKSGGGRGSRGAGECQRARRGDKGRNESSHKVSCNTLAHISNTGSLKQI